MDKTPKSADASREPLRARDFFAKHGFYAGLVALLVTHLALTFYFERPSVVFSDEPNAWIDFDTHIEQTYGVIDALERFGEAWSYEPDMLAGYPHGTIFDADNKGWELWTFTLTKLGISKGTGFNLYILLSILMVPWALFFSALLFGLGRRAALVAGWMGLALWFFDSYPRWVWWVGMTAYGISAVGAILPLAAFYRYLENRRIRHLILLAVTLALLHLNHPYTFVILVVPMLALYIGRLGSLRPVQHVLIFAAAGLTVAVNLYWLVTAVRFWHYILNSAFYCQSTLSFFFTDFLGLLQEPLVTGVVHPRTAFRFAFFAAAVLGLLAWRRERDNRLAALALGIGFMLALAYLGGYNLAFSQIQPYRHALPAMFFAIIPGAWCLERLVEGRPWRRTPSLVLAVVGLGLLVAASSFARDILYYFPERIPISHEGPLAEMAVKRTNPDIDGIWGPHMDFRHEETFEDFKDVARWLRNNDERDGRLLVEWWILAEHLIWSTNSQILGGFLERNLGHSDADLFRREHDRGPISCEEMAQYFEDYAVKWVLLSRLKVESIARCAHLFEKVGFMPPVHRLLATKVDVSYFAENDGRVKSSRNLIEVVGTDPERDAVLRFHYMETLACEPRCRLEREPVENDRVGFIRVPAPHPADFRIVNTYAFTN
jgi:hypothetical protein